LTFNDDGTELLVNMGEEQIYLFDINNHRNSKNFVVPVELGNKYCISVFIIFISYSNYTVIKFILVTNNGDQDCHESYIIDNNTPPFVIEDLSALNITELTPEVEELRQQVSFDNFTKL
jgi:hypothetical protein